MSGGAVVNSTQTQFGIRTIVMEEIAGMGEILHVYLLDEEHDMTEVGTICADGGKFSLTMEPNTVVVLK